MLETFKNETEELVHIYANGEYVAEAIWHEIFESPILSQLKGDYGMPSVPVGYVVHHDFNNGILQLVDEDMHRLFTHIEGHSLYKP